MRAGRVDLSAVCVQGTGGVGKTALAIVLANKLKDRYPDAQLFFNLRGAGADEEGYRSGTGIKPVTAADAMQSIIHCFRPEVKLPETVEELAPIYRSVLAGTGRALLLLDNAADAAQVKPLLPPLNCLLLVTTRAQFQLPGLTTRSLDCLRPANSCELLLKLAPRIKGHEASAAALCGYLPLALDVFAGAINDKRLTPVKELIERLRARLDKLTPVDAAFNVSYELLEAKLCRQWTLLAVFPASFDLRAADAVWHDGTAGCPQPVADTQATPGGHGEDAPPRQDLDSARTAMQELVNASLVAWNESNCRFRLHDLVRQFCDGLLTDAERNAVRLRHARHFRDVAAEADALFKGRDTMLHGVELFDRERAHIEAAFEWLQSRSDHESAALLVSLVQAVLYTGHDLRFAPDQRIRWLKSQCDAARMIKNRQHEANALGNLGRFYAEVGETRKAVEFYDQALIIDREIGDRHGEGADLTNLGRAYVTLGNPRKAIELLLNSATLAAVISTCDIPERYQSPVWVKFTINRSKPFASACVVRSFQSG